MKSVNHVNPLLEGTIVANHPEIVFIATYISKPGYRTLKYQRTSSGKKKSWNNKKMLWYNPYRS